MTPIQFLYALAFVSILILVGAIICQNMNSAAEACRQLGNCTTWS